MPKQNADSFNLISDEELVLKVSMTRCSVLIKLHRCFIFSAVHMCGRKVESEFGGGFSYLNIANLSILDVDFILSEFLMRSFIL